MRAGFGTPARTLELGSRRLENGKARRTRVGFRHGKSRRRGFTKRSIFVRGVSAHRVAVVATPMRLQACPQRRLVRLAAGVGLFGIEGQAGAGLHATKVETGRCMGRNCSTARVVGHATSVHADCRRGRTSGATVSGCETSRMYPGATGASRARRRDRPPCVRSRIFRGTGSNELSANQARHQKAVVRELLAILNVPPLSAASHCLSGACALLGRAKRALGATLAV